MLNAAATVVGILDESDILLRVVEDESHFADPVSTAMTARLETVPATATLQDLLPIFARDRVAIVLDQSAAGEGQFLGLITRIDLLNHLRRKIK